MMLDLDLGLELLKRYLSQLTQNESFIKFKIKDAEAFLARVKTELAENPQPEYYQWNIPREFQENTCWIREVHSCTYPSYDYRHHLELIFLDDSFQYRARKTTYVAHEAIQMIPVGILQVFIFTGRSIETSKSKEPSLYDFRLRIGDLPRYKREIAVSDGKTAEYRLSKPTKSNKQDLLRLSAQIKKAHSLRKDKTPSIIHRLSVGTLDKTYLVLNEADIQDMQKREKNLQMQLVIMASRKNLLGDSKGIKVFHKYASRFLANLRPDEYSKRDALLSEAFYHVCQNYDFDEENSPTKFYNYLAQVIYSLVKSERRSSMTPTGRETEEITRGSMKQKQGEGYVKLDLREREREALATEPGVTILSNVRKKTQRVCEVANELDLSPIKGEGHLKTETVRRYMYKWIEQGKIPIKKAEGTHQIRLNGASREKLKTLKEERELRKIVRETLPPIVAKGKRIKPESVQREFRRWIQKEKQNGRTYRESIKGFLEKSGLSKLEGSGE